MMILYHPLHIEKPQDPLVENSHPMKTIRKIRNLQSKAFIAHTDPSFVKLAFSQPQWSNIMQQEFMALTAYKTWTLITIPLYRKTMGYK